MGSSKGFSSREVVEPKGFSLYSAGKKVRKIQRPSFFSRRTHVRTVGRGTWSSQVGDRERPTAVTLIDAVRMRTAAISPAKCCKRCFLMCEKKIVFKAGRGQQPQQFLFVYDFYLPLLRVSVSLPLSSQNASFLSAFRSLKLYTLFSLLKSSQCSSLPLLLSSLSLPSLWSPALQFSLA